MVNQLTVTGRGVLKPDKCIDIYLNAVYDGREFDLHSVTKNRIEGQEEPLAILKFGRADKKQIVGELNYIAVSTRLNGRYEAEGFVILPSSPHIQEIPYSMGRNLTIRLSKGAQAAVETLRSIDSYNVDITGNAFGRSKN